MSWLRKRRVCKGLNDHRHEMTNIPFQRSCVLAWKKRPVWPLMPVPAPVSLESTPCQGLANNSILLQLHSSKKNFFFKTPKKYFKISYFSAILAFNFCFKCGDLSKKAVLLFYFVLTVIQSPVTTPWAQLLGEVHIIHCFSGPPTLTNIK